MYTERNRDSRTRAIDNGNGTGFYSPGNPPDAFIAAPQESELHFVGHSMQKDEGNFPPNGVWIHLNFETVVDLTVTEAPGAHRTCGAG